MFNHPRARRAIRAHLISRTPWPAIASSNHARLFHNKPTPKTSSSKASLVSCRSKPPKRAAKGAGGDLRSHVDEAPWPIPFVSVHGREIATRALRRVKSHRQGIEQAVARLFQQRVRAGEARGNTFFERPVEVLQRLGCACLDQCNSFAALSHEPHCKCNKNCAKCPHISFEPEEIVRNIVLGEG